MKRRLGHQGMHNYVFMHDEGLLKRNSTELMLLPWALRD